MKNCISNDATTIDGARTHARTLARTWRTSSDALLLARLTVESMMNVIQTRFLDLVAQFGASSGFVLQPVARSGMDNGFLGYLSCWLPKSSSSSSGPAGAITVRDDGDTLNATKTDALHPARTCAMQCRLMGEKN